ncbi:hypothetical protein X747_30740 [Mesorhizobium sp. LNJC384A00]|nr:hypothetical protein X751_30185 [Mesorhizobium sp. LNJC395A00]ESY33178.1 hypothetical protein X747_30740 [Mesorhizobium sp. LNJC384A00]
MTKRVESHDSLDRLEDGIPMPQRLVSAVEPTRHCGTNSKGWKRSAERSSKPRARVVDDTLVQVR